jgi:GNAT superfamily N-acetyltransferase
MTSDAELLEVCYAGIEPLVLTRGPLTGSQLKTSPKSSLLNAFAIERGRSAEIGPELPAIDVAMADAGVSAWGIWIVEGDGAAETAASEYGMVLDSKPRAMGVDLADLVIDPDAAADVEQRWDPRLMAEINERAYGVKPGRFSEPLAEMPQPASTQMFFAESEKGTAAVVLSLHLPGGDCSFYWVATDPDRQREGNGRRAMSAALLHAQEAGCTTTTLQASPHGVPLYLAIGYRDLGKAVNLWEMRR